MKKKRWEILHEDDDLIIVNKPAPFLTIPDRFDPTIPNLVASLKSYREEIYINHRLDKETSGIILFSKNAETHEKMSHKFEHRDIRKLYKALLVGVPPIEVGEITLPLSQHPVKKKGMRIDEGGKKAQTKFRILESFKDNSFVEFNLMTGRMHQIRVHAQSMYTPILCDSLYGDGNPFFLSQIKRKFRKRREEEERPLLSRMALHASELSFENPNTGMLITVECPLPKDMKAVLNQLRKTNP